MFQLKPITLQAVPKALERAERYRYLNEPVEAESICLDVLKIDAENEQAKKTLLLALTDQFEARLTDAFEEAKEVALLLSDEYSRQYYLGVIYERRAKTHFRRGRQGAGHVAYEWFRKAMECYEKAEQNRPADNDEAILRWNACARILKRHESICPRPQEDAEQMLE